MKTPSRGILMARTTKSRRVAWGVAVLVIGIAAILARPTFPLFWTWLTVERVEETYSDGSLKQVFSRYRWGDKKGKRVGVFSKWSPSGQIVIEGHYEDGKETDDWRKWNKQGDLIMHCVFRGGVPYSGVAVGRHFLTGVITSQTAYRGGVTMKRVTSPPWLSESEIEGWCSVQRPE